MTEEEFWKIVEQVRLISNGEKEKYPSALKFILEEFSTEDLISYQNELLKLTSKAYKNKVWAAAYIINGGASTDGFLYFRLWLVFQGKEIFYKAISEPDSLENLPVDYYQYDAEFEEALYIGQQIYGERTGNQMEYNSDIGDQGIWPDDEPWEDKDLPNIVPKLYKKYHE